MKDGSSIAVRVYLAIHAPLKTKAEEVVQEESSRIFKPDLIPANVNVRVYEGKGSRFSPPFVGFEASIDQHDYDYDKLQSNLDTLFEMFTSHKEDLRRFLSVDGIEGVFAIVFDAQSHFEKPAFDLSEEKLLLLGELGVSLSVESYLSFT